MSDQPVETLFLSTIPGATPSKWIHRYSARGSNVQLVTQDEQSQTLFLQPHDPPRYLPQLGYVRWRADQSWQQLMHAHGLDPDKLHLVRLYDEAPVIMVSKDHLLAAWTEEDGDVSAADLEDETFWNPEDYVPEPVTDPLDAPEQVGAGERMAIQLAATGSGYSLLPASVARMFGQKDLIVLPTDIHPGWEVGLAWRKAADSDLVQDFIGVTKGRRPRSSR
ncbi:MAG: LysR family transcriptional regulator substrate-binding protein [Micrococcaceae bacterium]|nr:LysR family transcriptional regulator substrate-binding protein [Micrococcaceae bacterium]